MMTPLLLFGVTAGFLPELLIGDTTSYDVWVELFKVIGIGISSVASCVALFLARRDHRTSRRVEAKVEKKRKAVRRRDAPGDGEQVVIVEERRKDPRGKDE